MANTGEIRLNGKIAFDPVKEQYMADAMNEMSAHHTISAFLERLAKIAFDNPEYLERPEKLKELMEFMSKGGMTPRAEAFYSEAKKDIAEIKDKVNAIYDMCLKLYTLAAFADVIGLKARTENLARAEFLIERQVSSICDRMGIRDYKKFSSGSYLELDKKSGDILEYIIDHYSGVVSEIKSDMAYIQQPVVVANTQTQITEQAAKNEQPVKNEQIKESGTTQVESKQTQVNQGVSTSKLEVNSNESIDDGEVIDFWANGAENAYDPSTDHSAALKLLGFN